MKDSQKTTAQLLRELEEARARIAELEASESKHQQMEAELAREREMLQTLLESSPDYIFFKDRATRFIRTNKAHARRLLGLTGPEEAVGKTDFDLFDKGEAQRFFDEEQHIMASNQPVIAREWPLHSSTTGETVWLSEHKIPITDKTGQTIGLLGISRDITKHKEAEAALARERYIVDTFLENVPDSIYFKDRECRIIRANKAHASKLGFQETSEELGKTDFDFFPEDQAQVKYEQEQEIILTGRAILSLEEQDGKGSWALTTKMPLRDEHGEIIGTFGISRDITPLKQAQEALESAYAEISSLNEQLKEDNLRMSVELNVARRLQTMILPRPDELQQIEGVEIVGFMQPADEVGGDYYDIFSEHGMLHIGIGDVTGHGLESGVLMLMTQTAIRTLIEHGETDPLELVTTLNRTLYKNIQRANLDKTLTLAFVKHHNGQLRVVGQHEELIVVRQGGQVERLDTIELGFPIGLEEDIGDWVAEATVVLEPGDGIVLYTDGITEAEGKEGTMYGIERLCHVVSQNWDKSAEAIKQTVITDVTRHIGEQKVYDDLTLVVLKQQ